MLAAVVIFGFIFELLLEVVFEFLGEFVVQVLGDAVLKPLWRRYGSEGRKHLLIGMFAGLLAFGYGYAWGAYRVADGAETLPQSVWVTLAMAAAFALAAIFQPRLAGWGPDDASPPDLRTGQPVGAPVDRRAVRAKRVRSAVLPWTWSRDRLANFAAVNVAISAGIVGGYLTWG